VLTHYISSQAYDQHAAAARSAQAGKKLTYMTIYKVIPMASSSW
jgi:hypothetical protein